jgi:hypothetical protein
MKKVIKILTEFNKIAAYFLVGFAVGFTVALMRN